jgi:hypothetical protein
MKPIFSANPVNTKVVDKFVSFPESTITKESESVYGRYDQNNKHGRDKCEQDEMTECKRT